MKKIVILGSGFAGVSAAKALCRNKETQITVIDKRNYHVFQPLLYQVAMAALSPDDIAVPIRAIFSRHPNVAVLQESARAVDLLNRKVVLDNGEIPYDDLVMACGAEHTYFGHDEWEEFAPGLKSLEQATEIKNRILLAFEKSESQKDEKAKVGFLTFVVVGGGPTGVELAGAIAEMGHLILSKDFRNIDPKKIKVVLIERLPRILEPFSENMSRRATRDLEEMGVEVRTSCAVTKIDTRGVDLGNERIDAATVIWAAGVQASSLNKTLGLPLDRQGRVPVEPDLSIKGYPEVFVLGDQASCLDKTTGKPLPGVAAVALQQGHFVAQNILREMNGLPRQEFRYCDRGKAATIGRSRAIVEVGRWQLSGFFAWLIWLMIHLWFLTGFEKRLMVLLKWAWAYIFHYHGARIVIGQDWRLYQNSKQR